jgi:hypothetical protein
VQHESSRKNINQNQRGWFVKEKIIAMVQRSPGIKTGQIADQLDVTFAEAQALLAQLVNDGVLKGGLEALAGGGKVMSYELTDKGTRLTPPQAFSRPPFEPKPVARSTQPTSKIQRAILHIEEHGPTASTALRGVMDLAEGANVWNYLAPAVKNGRLHLDDGVWKLGPGPVEVRAPLSEMATAAATELRKPEPAPDVAAIPERAYRCAIWLDGKVEIHKNGYRVILTQAELGEIVAFVAERRVA